MQVSYEAPDSGEWHNSAIIVAPPGAGDVYERIGPDKVTFGVRTIWMAANADCHALPATHLEGPEPFSQIPQSAIGNSAGMWS